MTIARDPIFGVEEIPALADRAAGGAEGEQPRPSVGGEQPPEAHPVRAERAAPSLAPGQPLGVRHHFTSTSIHGVPEVLTTYAPASDTHQVTFGTRGAWITLSTHGLEETAALAAALSRAADELLRKLDLPEAGEPLRMSGP